jgi:hypothetical protein
MDRAVQAEDTSVVVEYERSEATSACLLTTQIARCQASIFQLQCNTHAQAFTSTKPSSSLAFSIQNNQLPTAQITNL